MKPWMDWSAYTVQMGALSGVLYEMAGESWMGSCTTSDGSKKVIASEVSIVTTDASPAARRVPRERGGPLLRYDLNLWYVVQPDPHYHPEAEVLYAAKAMARDGKLCVLRHGNAASLESNITCGGAFIADAYTLSLDDPQVSEKAAAYMRDGWHRVAKACGLEHLVREPAHAM